MWAMSPAPPRRAVPLDTLQSDLVLNCQVGGIVHPVGDVGMDGGLHGSLEPSHPLYSSRITQKFVKRIHPFLHIIGQLHAAIVQAELQPIHRLLSISMHFFHNHKSLSKPKISEIKNISHMPMQGMVWQY